MSSYAARLGPNVICPTEGHPATGSTSTLEIIPVAPRHAHVVNCPTVPHAPGGVSAGRLTRFQAGQAVSPTAAPSASRSAFEVEPMIDHPACRLLG